MAFLRFDRETDGWAIMLEPGEQVWKWSFGKGGWVHHGVVPGPIGPGPIILPGDVFQRRLEQLLQARGRTELRLSEEEMNDLFKPQRPGFPQEFGARRFLTRDDY